MKLLQKLTLRIQDPHLKEVFTGASIALGFKVGGMAINFIFIFLVSRYYGPKGTGIYGLSMTVILISIMIGSLGFGSSIVRFVSQFVVEGQLSKIKVLYKNILQIILPLSIILSVFLYAYAETLALIIFHDQDLIFALKIISFVIPFAVMYRINIEVIRGFKNIRLSEYIRHLNRNLFNIFIFLGLNLVFASHYLPVFSYCFALVISCLMGSLFVFRYLVNTSGTGTTNFSKKELLKVSAPMMMTDFMHLLNHHIDIIMLGILATTSSVGVYAISLKLAEVTSLTVIAINRIAMPKFSELYWSDKIKDLKKVIRFSTKIRFWTASPVLLLYIANPDFFMGLFGKEFVIGKNALICLAVGQLVNAASGPVANLLNMIGRQTTIRNIIVIATLMNIGLNFLLIPKYGVTGAAIATMSATVFWNITAVIYTKVTVNIRTHYIPIICS